jgi:hypothetical protein
MIGERFGFWTVLERAGVAGKARVPTWRVRCACGRVADRIGAELRRGRTLSCGCGLVGWAKIAADAEVEFYASALDADDADEPA